MIASHPRFSQSLPLPQQYRHTVVDLVNYLCIRYHDSRAKLTQIIFAVGINLSFPSR